VAGVAIAGTSLDVLGSLYLAYDLLGGQHGPLRVLTRMVTYSVVFGLGYGAGLGWLLGLTCGVTAGATVAFELRRASEAREHFPLPLEALFSSIRGAGFGAGLYPLLGLRFALAFAGFITAGQIFQYSRGMRPGIDYSAERKPRLTRRQIRGVIVRTLGYIATALICSALVHHVDHSWTFALRVGLVTGLATALGTAVNPLIEYYADSLPERRLGVFGIGLILLGFTLQSLQYWLSLLDVPIT